MSKQGMNVGTCMIVSCPGCGNEYDVASLARRSKKGTDLRCPYCNRLAGKVN